MRIVGGMSVSSGQAVVYGSRWSGGVSVVGDEHDMRLRYAMRSRAMSAAAWLCTLRSLVVQKSGRPLKGVEQGEDQGRSVYVCNHVVEAIVPKMHAPCFLYTHQRHPAPFAALQLCRRARMSRTPFRTSRAKVSSYAWLPPVECPIQFGVHPLPLSRTTAVRHGFVSKGGRLSMSQPITSSRPCTCVLKIVDSRYRSG